ncbi:MAG: glycosyltransferase family 4 protein [Armatimonadota bacterium]|nr:glycosyltransferase family 4 protein [Armatimonadota bacterium]MDR7412699.1 glycosyltransferase family 4 protein [Armatimonadota bacterium]MDR7433429.1 glycosyltransferase family 4 protein [Armatimonadota bacterium]MDR7446454.1 glycosyltransferase family 4 protein [Armatimonadota bacterium]MDR7462590.1 glycosyltransferase family 4 protein [Armatimonadota bacterium]
MPDEVVLLHYSAPPVVGGVESVLAQQARWLRRAGYRVRVVTGKGAGPDVEVLPLLYGRHPEVRRAQAAALRGDTGPLERVRDRIASELAPRLPGRVCIVHNVFTLAKNLPLLAALHQLLDAGVECRWVAWTHDVAWDNPAEVGRVPDGPLRELLRRPRPEVAYVAISQAVRSSLARHLGLEESRVEVIPPGVSLEGLRLVGPQTRRILHELPWGDRYPVLLVPVRITRRKNLELAVRVAACLRDQDLSPLVVVTGPLGAHTAANARYLDELRGLRRALAVEDHVVFLAERGIRCSPRTVGELYLLCDAVLVPSVLEGFGLPVAEAGLLRVPVFCTRIAAATEVAGELAHFFDVEEPPESVARRIAQELASDRAARLRRRVVEQFGWEQVAREGLVPLVARLCASAVPG